MKINELQDQVTEDFNLTYKNIQEKIYTVPNIHSKYLNLFLNERRKLIEVETQKDKMYREKYYYYTNEYDYELSSKEKEFHIISDEEFSVINKKYQNQKAVVNYLEMVVKKAQQLTFDVKNIVENMKYLTGV